METVTMTEQNMWSFLEWSGGFFANSGPIQMQIDNAERYPSLKEEGAPRFLGMAKLCARYDTQLDTRKAIPVL